jgi:hypothetical protein
VHSLHGSRQTLQKFKRLILWDISIVQDEHEFIAELLHERLESDEIELIQVVHEYPPSATASIISMQFRRKAL